MIKVEITVQYDFGVNGVQIDAHAFKLDGPKTLSGVASYTIDNTDDLVTWVQIVTKQALNKLMAGVTL